MARVHGAWLGHSKGTVGGWVPVPIAAALGSCMVGRHFNALMCYFSPGSPSKRYVFNMTKTSPKAVYTQKVSTKLVISLSSLS